MHSVTSFLDFQILELIHFQKNFQGGQGRAKGGPMLPPAPLKETLNAPMYTYENLPVWGSPQ